MEFLFKNINDIIAIPFIVTNKYGVIVYENKYTNKYIKENESFTIIRNKILYNGVNIPKLIGENKNYNLILDKDGIINGVASIKKKILENNEFYFIKIFHQSEKYCQEDLEEVFISGLSKSETAIVFLIASGLTPEEISKKRNSSINTVRHQIKSIQNKIGVKNIYKISSLFSAIW